MSILAVSDASALSGGCCPVPSGTTGETTALCEQHMFRGPETTALSGQPVFCRPIFARRDMLPVWLPGVVTKLCDLASLENNWDSYGASPIDPRSIAKAQELIQFLAVFVGVAEPAVGASPDGEAGLSWDGGPWSLDIDVTRDGRIDYVYIDDRDATRDQEASTRSPYELLALLTAWD